MIWGIIYLSSTYYLLITYLLSIYLSVCLSVYLSITYQSCILCVVFTFLTLFHSKHKKNRGLTFLQRFCSRIHSFTTLKYCNFYYWLVCPNFSPKSFATLEPLAGGPTSLWSSCHPLQPCISPVLSQVIQHQIHVFRKDISEKPNHQVLNGSFPLLHFS